MTEFNLHTLETAPEGSKEILSGALKQNGFIPNLYGMMAESPELLKAYTQMALLFNETSLSPVEKNIVWLTVSQSNSCHYCMSIHSMVAKMFKLPDDMIESLRSNLPLEDVKLETLRQFTTLLVEKSGGAQKEDIETFIAAGFTKKTYLNW